MADEPARPAPDEVSEAAIVAFLASPETHGGAAPDHIETHLSHLFLAADRALKLKKRVDWSVVDYSSLEKREAYCRRELEVNRRFAPDLYLAVVPVTVGATGLALGGDGTPVDYVVEMRRFPADAQLDTMADAGTLTPALADATADAIAAMHRGAPVAKGAGGADRIAALTAQLQRDVAPGLAAEAARDLAAWADAAEAALGRLAPLAERRARHGFVRRCHGDLHLSNICLWNGRPTPFDAIEFSEDIATIDVLYDLAFVLVDLDSRDLRALASRLLSRYLEATRDYAGLALLPLFLSQRAMVRALTRAAKGRDAAPSVRLARTYLAHAAEVLPRLIAVGGLSGTGKTTVARGLALTAGAVVIRSDSVRKRLAGHAPEERLDGASYTAAATGAVYRRLRVDARRALHAGCPVILDATFADPAERHRAETVAAMAGVPFTGLWLSAPDAALRRRIAARHGDASDADTAVLDAQIARGTGPMHWSVVDASADPDAVTAAAARAMAI
ncbi:AAA family ATPase [Acuticoccus yangtzensis]|uniref:bifunctional aminoglycoside phosphotransferase/ATP-binding protein n=1 Tax=Acuticoccus yangtzensis TaxID=1443441 RepID=UPI00094976D3|nr:bifunctional aminoglycoside phosphotransferase/ATP-binding protein [Acuticoccus yangtzensis]